MKSPKLLEKTECPPEVGEVQVTDAAAKAVAQSGHDWAVIWPRHLRALYEGKSTFSIIDLPQPGPEELMILLAIGTEKTHTNSFVALLSEVKEFSKTDYAQRYYS